MNITIQYAAPYDIDVDRKGDWIDLRSNEDVTFEEGDYKEIDLGIRILLPVGVGAIVAPRSSTFKNFGIISTNSIGIIDSNYIGYDDVWKFPSFSPKGGEVCKGDRIAQFRLQLSQFAPSYIIKWWNMIDEIEFENVGFDDTDPRVIDWKNINNRGGIGSTGIR